MVSCDLCINPSGYLIANPVYIHIYILSKNKKKIKFFGVIINFFQVYDDHPNRVIIDLK